MSTTIERPIDIATEFGSGLNLNPADAPEGITNELVEQIDLEERLRLLASSIAPWNEPDLTTVTGIWDDELDDYKRFHVQVKFIDKVMGGTPRNPELIAGWLKKNMGVTSEEQLVAATRRTLTELGVVTPELASLEELTAAAEALGAEKHGNTFKRDSTGLFLEGRHVKAGLKESTNIAYAGDRWGKTKKGPKSAMAEWVFVDDIRVHLYRDGEPITSPDDAYVMHGVVNGPQGPRSTLTQYDYCFQPELSWTMFSFEDRVQPDQWIKILKHMQFMGFGALRSQSFGRFKVQAFDQL